MTCAWLSLLAGVDSKSTRDQILWVFVITGGKSSMGSTEEEDLCHIPEESNRNVDASTEVNATARLSAIRRRTMNSAE